VIKPVTGLFLIFWGIVKVYQGWVLFNGGDDLGVGLIVFGALAALVGGLFLRDSLR